MPMEEYGYNFGDNKGQIIIYETSEGETLDIMDYSVAEILSEDNSQEYIELMLDKEEFQGLGNTEIEKEHLAREIDALNNSDHYQATSWDSNYDKDGLIVLGGYTPDRKALYEFIKGIDFLIHEN